MSIQYKNIVDNILKNDSDNLIEKLSIIIVEEHIRNSFSLLCFCLGYLPMSISEDLFDVKILNIDLYTVELDNKLICQAISLNLEQNHSLFLDPFNYGGIEIGNNLDKEKWINSHSTKTITHNLVR